MNQTLSPLKVVLALTASSASILWASYLLLILAFLIMLLTHLNILALLIIFAASIQHYLYIRIQFDRQLLQQMIQSQDTLHAQTEQLDQALLDLKLISSKKSGRIWTVRLTGILRLFKLQCVVLAIQLMLLVGMICLGAR